MKTVKLSSGGCRKWRRSDQRRPETSRAVIGFLLLWVLSAGNWAENAAAFDFEDAVRVASRTGNPGV